MDDDYLDLTTYNEIYRELIYQRNEAIRWLTNNALLERNRRVTKESGDEWLRHQTAAPFRSVFSRVVPGVLNRLYRHDALEAVYDFQAVELGDWSNTEANMLERQLQRLQVIIGKLETRYQLQYQLVFEYAGQECTLYLNSIKVFSCGQSTLRHRLLETLFSKSDELWTNEDIESYFIDSFGYSTGGLSDKNIEKAAKDIIKDVASKTAVKDMLIVSGSSARINPRYLV
jgi:hypothetical protein